MQPEEAIQSSKKNKTPIPTTRQRQRITWTNTESSYLVAGVILYKKGNWATILAKYSTHFNEYRTSVNLKDKYRNIEKDPALLRSLTKLAEAIIDKDLAAKDN